MQPFEAEQARSVVVVGLDFEEVLEHGDRLFALLELGEQDGAVGKGRRVVGIDRQYLVESLQRLLVAQHVAQRDPAIDQRLDVIRLQGDGLVETLQCKLTVRTRCTKC